MPKSIKCVSCGVAIFVPLKDDVRWSVRTDAKNRVIEMHVSLLCEACGKSEITEYDDARTPLTAYNLVVEEVDPPVSLKTFADGRYV